MDFAAKQLSSWAVMAVCLLALLGCAERKAEPFIAADITGAGYGSDFRLTDQHGKTRTMADFKGKAVLLFFGYTHCPDVCLTILSELAMVRQHLGRDAERMQILFVTLDPVRDTPEKLAAFVTYFHQDFLALYADEASIAKVADGFKVHYSKHDSGSAAGYLLDHSAGIYGFDSHGRLRILINYGTDPAAVVHDVKLLLGN